MDKINYDSVIEEGVILPIYKPLMWTSFDVVKFVRNLLKKTYNLKKIKVGHAGTLDPLATGILVLCIGKKTKEINKIQEENKTYLATIKIGESTPSYDRETEIDNTYPTSHINEELIMDSIKSFRGKSEQTPPVYSALKIDGKRSYELARKGEKIIPKKIFKSNVSSIKNESLSVNKLAPNKAGIDKTNDIFAASYLLNFKNLEPVITTPALLAPGIKANI